MPGHVCTLLPASRYPHPSAGCQLYGSHGVGPILDELQHGALGPGLERYLDEAEPYNHMHMMLFSHSVECVGLVRIEHWRRILQRARKGWSFLGVEETVFPMDFAVFARYQNDIKNKIRSRYPVDSPMQLDQLNEFLQRYGDRYPVHWQDGWWPEETEARMAG